MIAYTVAYRRTDLIEYQLRCLRKFCPVVSELVVGNNGPDHAVIDRECQRLGLRTVHGPTWGEHASWSHAYMVDILWRNHAALSTENSLIFEGDIFPIAPVNPEQWLQDADIVGRCDVRNGFLYPVPMLVALRAGLPDAEQICWQPAEVNGTYCDTGARAGLWLSQHPQVSCRALPLKNVTFSQSWRWELYDNAWLHHIAGSNWCGNAEAFEQHRSEILEKFLQWYLLKD